MCGKRQEISNLDDLVLVRYYAMDSQKRQKLEVK